MNWWNSQILKCTEANKLHSESTEHKTQKNLRRCFAEACLLCDFTLIMKRIVYILYDHRNKYKKICKLFISVPFQNKIADSDGNVFNFLLFDLWLPNILFVNF